MYICSPPNCKTKYISNSFIYYFFLFYKIRSQILLVFMKSVVSPGLRSTLIYMRLSICSLCDQHKFRREILAAAREQSKMWKMTGEGEAAEQHSSRRDRKQGGCKRLLKTSPQVSPQSPSSLRPYTTTSCSGHFDFNCLWLRYPSFKLRVTTATIISHCYDNKYMMHSNTKASSPRSPQGKW